MTRPGRLLALWNSTLGHYSRRLCFPDGMVREVFYGSKKPRAVLRATVRARYARGKPAAGSMVALRDACRRQSFFYGDPMVGFTYWHAYYARIARREATRNIHARLEATRNIHARGEPAAGALLTLRDADRGWWQEFIAALECGSARRAHIICRRNQKSRKSTRRRYGR